MKGFMFVLGTTLIIACALATPPGASAALDGVCTVNPAVITFDQVAFVECSGFDPNTYVWLYAVAPGGTVYGQGAVKSDQNGRVRDIFGVDNRPYFVLGLGTVTEVFQQLGPGGTIKHQAVFSVTVTGGHEGVSGATLRVSPTTLDRVHTTTLFVTGTGFAPNEVVTAWFNYPPVCPGSLQPIAGDGNYPSAFFDNTNFSTAIVGNFKADASGSIAFVIPAGPEVVGFEGALGTIGPLDCAGNYQIVARGNASQRGGVADFVVTGPSVTADATLTPSKPSVNSLGDSISFYASGFGANEALSCWLTSPYGNVIAFIGTIKTDGAGRATVPYYTGLDEEVSAGPLGPWSLTCRGNSSERTGIARFEMTGGFLDP